MIGDRERVGSETGRGRVWRREKDGRLGEWGEKVCEEKRGEGRQRVGMEGERECAVEGREGDKEGEGIVK